MVGWRWRLVRATAVFAIGCSDPTRAFDAASLDSTAPADGEIASDASSIVDGAVDGTDAMVSPCSGGVPAGTTVALSSAVRPYAFAISPTSDRVVFLGDPETRDVFALYAAPIGGGSLVRLSHYYGPGTAMYVTYAFTPDGANVVFIADPGALGQSRLYRAPIDGSTITTLHAGAEPVLAFKVSPASDRVAFDTYAAAAGEALLLVPIGGGEALPLAPAPSEVALYYFTPDGARLVVEVGTSGDGSRIFSIPAAGGTPAAISPEGLYAGGNSRLSADGTTIFFAGVSTMGAEPALYRGSVSGGTATAIAGSEGVDAWLVTPDASTVLLVTDREFEGHTRLYRLPVAGGTPTLLSHDNLDDARLDVLGVHISPDGSRVVFEGPAEWPDVVRLYSTPTAGGAIQTLSANLGINTSLHVGFPVITPAGDVVVYVGDTEVDELHRVYATPIAGGAVRILLPNIAADATRDASVALLSSRRDVLYVTNFDVVDQWRVWRTNLDAGGPEAISPVPPSELAGVTHHDVTPDGCWALYQGFFDGAVPDREQLYATKLW